MFPAEAGVNGCDLSNGICPLVFPAKAGVNGHLYTTDVGCKCVPRNSGGERGLTGPSSRFLLVFPAIAGVIGAC